ncbi:DNA polymerase II [Thalassotalea sp. PS06]|uniref:DNA polymerase II n=1 Tax=Thalassotalea sp. PS06 TaxID=2594005 RepID=UPI0021B11F6F|nr:DNA polymerase II [Thalassotalea sp. PS06]
MSGSDSVNVKATDPGLNPENRQNSEPMPGFVLTRQIQETVNGIQLIFWLQTDSGPVKLEIDGEQPVFFVETKYANSAAQTLKQHNINHNNRELELTAYNSNKVTGFYFQRLSQFYVARDRLKEQGIKVYEDDVRPDDRFLMERFIYGSLIYTGANSANLPPISNPQSANATYQHIQSGRAKAGKYTPKLSMLSLDVECSFAGELYSIGFYQDNRQVVIMIGQPEPDAEDYIVWVDDEKALLHATINLINNWDPDTIIGWNVVGFDMRLLQKRCDLHNIPFAIGRDGSVLQWRQNRMSPEQHFVMIPGRVTLDGIDLLKTATYNFPSFSLENVSQTLLGVGKEIDDVDSRGEEITRKFRHDKQALAKYNLMDCKLVWDIFIKTQLLEFAILRSTLTGLELDRIGGSVAAFTNLYLPKLHRAGFIAPNLGDGERDLVSPGGYVMDSIPGLYKNVLVLDFKSLYPSIIRTFKIDPMGMVIGMEQAETEPEKVIPGYDGASFSREQHFLPEIIESLWAERDKAKALKNAPLSQAIKIIMNSFYGVLGSNGCRFFDPRLSGSITKRSHDLLKTTQQWIDDLGYRVIYGDTDSIFVSIGEEHDDTKAQKIGEELMDLINARWQQKLIDDYQIESALEIEFETHFHTFLMPTVRGTDIGTKKRYAGLVGRDEQEQLVFKGLESVRTDWTELAKCFQQNLYLKVFHNEPVEAYIREMVNDTMDGKFDHMLTYRKRLRRKLDDYQKNVPPHVKAARHADDIHQANNQPLRYQNKGWIEYVMTVAGPQTLEHQQAPIDYQLYIDRQLAAIADGILPFIDKDFNSICDQQMQLF